MTLRGGGGGGGGGSRLSVIMTLSVGNMICESPLSYIGKQNYGMKSVHNSIQK